MWKCVVETKGTPTRLPLRSSGAAMPAPSRTTIASASAMFSTIQNSSIGSLRLNPAAIGLDPAIAMSISPEDIALITFEPESNLRKLISAPVASPNFPSTIETFHGL